MKAQVLKKKPAAPKVPRRGSLAVDATVQICQTGTASAGGAGAAGRAGKSRFPALLICTFCRSAQHGQVHRFDPT